MGRNILITCSAFVNAVGESVHVPAKEEIRLMGGSVHGGDLWAELHAKLSPDDDWFKSWCDKIPPYGSCGCRAWLSAYLIANPPRFHDWPRYSWELHNAVNDKLGKLYYAWENYQAQYLGRWKRVDGHQIGIVSVNYELIGGTETFHQTLVPRLSNVVGFASQTDLKGDINRLGVPSAQGLDSIASLASQCDTVIAWNIDWSEMPRPERLITVHHGSLADDHGTRLCLQGDEIVCVSEDVANKMRTITDKPVYWIPNAVDPDRIKPINAVETNGKRICLWAHRFSNDKRPQLAAEIAKHLPDDWRMVLTGHRGESIELNDRVTVLPPQHPGDWLSVASCFLSTSLFDGFGLSMAESIVAGVPVVATPVGIASRPGLAVTVPIDAIPEQWAAAIVSSSDHVLPSRELFSIDAFLASWESVVAQRNA